MAGDTGVGVQTPCHEALLYVLLFILLGGLRRLQACKFTDFGKAIEKHPPLEFSKASRAIYLDHLVKCLPRRLITFDCIMD